MKKILFMAICLFTAGSVSAQQYYYGPRHPHHQQKRSNDDFYTVKVGITGGLNIANTVDAYDSYNSTGTIAGFNAGLYFDVPLAYPVSFEPEVLFSQKGFTAQLDDGTNFTSRANFIDVPLLAKFHLVPGFNLLLGPQISFLTSTNNTYHDPTGTTTDNYNYNGNNTIVAGVFGVSFDINPMVEIRARYALDLTANGNNDGPDYRNQVFQIGLGFRIK
ncbi:porin family protein [Mucilaginibacter sp. X5P1]|uniref:porin family protein n=1 Tax=Mucilaginibacter sp. X5P1 TaxID=2723088 RepID=UPI00161AB22D|nr:porin family protein [Mucilaginibacter sp. X5P1]MBB6139069.1 hypothetical protein [Mucilaginibacter sp. X5P1]